MSSSSRMSWVMDEHRDNFFPILKFLRLGFLVWIPALSTRNSQKFLPRNLEAAIRVLSARCQSKRIWNSRGIKNLSFRFSRLFSSFWNHGGFGIRNGNNEIVWNKGRVVGSQLRQTLGFQKYPKSQISFPSSRLKGTLQKNQERRSQCPVRVWIFHVSQNRMEELL